MSTTFPSIQSFFPKRPPTHQPSTAGYAPLGDAFSSAELAEALDPSLREWKPTTSYEASDIGSLVVGSRAVRFAGRLVNFAEWAVESKMPQAAKGYHRLLVRDGSGVIIVSFVDPLLRW